MSAQHQQRPSNIQYPAAVFRADSGRRARCIADLRGCQRWCLGAKVV